MTMQYRFANYLFDSHAGLSFDGRAVHLPPKEKGLLQLLLMARGQIVRKDGLWAAVWRSGEISDESISRTVYRLRAAMHALGGPDVVETVYNSGFRVTVPIREIKTEESYAYTSMTNSTRPNAVACLLSAREFVARRTPDDVEAAAHAAQLAISIDPTFAAAWAALAEIRVFQATRGLRPPREAGRLAKNAAQSALDLDPESSSALAIRGWVRVMIEQDCSAGLEDLDRAAIQDPDYWVSSLLRGWGLQAAGRHEEAIVMMRRALELNAMGHSVNAILALFLLFSGRTAEALKTALELARRFPTIDNAQGIASVVAAVNGLHEEAAAFGWKAMELAPHTPAMHAPLAYALAFSGRHDEARKVLGLIEEAKLPKPSAAIASAYLALGEREKAVELLKDASERGIPQFAWTRDDPRLASLRGDPVVEQLWAKIWTDQKT